MVFVATMCIYVFLGYIDKHKFTIAGVSLNPVFFDYVIMFGLYLETAPAHITTPFAILFEVVWQ